MEKLILSNPLAPGDIVMMTAAVRDLHLTYPKRFLTDVRTPCPALWASNPYITPIRDNERGVRRIECRYPLIHRSNSAPYHFIHGFTQHLGEVLGLPIEPTLFKGDIHLSNLEREWASQVAEMTGSSHPFWIIAAGGKQDFTIKWWDTPRWQEVVDRFQGRIHFVQVGEEGHHHPPLRGVLDLRGKTCLRQLVRLVHHAQGVLCPVTSLMHLAAAVETRPAELTRPCVVVAGGREPPHWEAYPGHRFIHTMGALSCCSNGGCWRSRTVPLNDGDEKDLPQNLCLDVVGNLPRCMDIITPEQAVAQIESYFHAGGPWRYLTPDEADKLAGPMGWDRRELRFRRSRTHAHDTRWTGTAHDEAPLTPANVPTRLTQAIKQLPQPVAGNHLQLRGVVICGGGLSYLPSVWVNVQMLRRHGCRLPVELWHFPGEVDPTMEQLLGDAGVTCIDAHQHMDTLGLPRVGSGWELKPLAILYSTFEEVLFLDADNMAVRDPEYLFDDPHYRDTGAVYWPDYTSLVEDDPIWKICGVDYRDEPEFESGQILVNKLRHWRPLQLALWFNRHAAFFRHYFLGDKETFHFAFRYLEVPYSMPPFAIENLANKTMCQHDFSGRRIFQHRNLAKWSLHGRNTPIPGFELETEALQSLQQLKTLWPGRVATVPRWHEHPDRTRMMNAFAATLQSKAWHLYHEGGESCRVMLNAEGHIISHPSSARFLYWDMKKAINRPRLVLSSEKGPVAELEKDPQGNWLGICTDGGDRKRIGVSQIRKPPHSEVMLPAYRSLVSQPWAFRIEGRQQRSLTLRADGVIEEGAGHMEMYWHLLTDEQGQTTLQLRNWDQLTTRMTWNPAGFWEGAWINEKEPVITLRPLRTHSTEQSPPSLVSRAMSGMLFPSHRDWESDDFQRWCEAIREKRRYHRRQWEVITTLRLVEHLKASQNINRIIVLSPTDDSLVDGLAKLELEVVCALDHDWSDLPPSHRRNKLLSAKREFNRRGITPWQVFEKRVRVWDSGGAIPEEENDDPEHTVIIWHNPFKKHHSSSGETQCLDQLAATVPHCLLAVLVFDVSIEPADIAVNSRNGPPPRTLLEVREWLDRDGEHASASHLSRPSTGAFPGDSPVDSYVDCPPYQSAHHLRLRTPHGVITSVCVCFPHLKPRPDLAASALSTSSQATSPAHSWSHIHPSITLHQGANL
ncbi:glycosyltransferase family 9 protein [Verrucomicrobium sp. BvORR034]|uniref:glycosyltransferase family 9 protein n=1 Tax=Verrucomicrobium sp. BvORR034 TaxID=1396418 RepID=UPI0009E0939C|nr:glycosyltransferase family 9 protein [Verrucomicrobium sp. BvORR034]